MRKNHSQAWLGCFCRCLLVVSVFSIGCGGEAAPVVVPVRGVVTLNGKPVEGAEVIFRVADSSRFSGGVTNDKGEYQLTTFNTDDGAIVGENLISVRSIPKDFTPMAGVNLEDMKTGKAKPNINAGSRPKADVTSPSMIPLKYSNPEKSGLKRSVVKGDKNEFNLDLKP